MKKNNANLKPATLCVHAGGYHDAATGAVTTPIFTASSYACPNPSGQNIYQRYSNTPNQRAVAAKLAALEQGGDALVFGSGMAAITTVLFALLEPGDHAVFQEDLYGGTYHFVAAELTQFGVEVSFVKANGDFAAQIRPATKLIFVESPSNPLLRCVDLAAIAALGKARGLLTVIDNTFATPINQNPLVLGADLVLHSATKFLGGHADALGGVLCGAPELIAKVYHYREITGASLDPMAAYLLVRSMKTLALRVRQQNENALTIARWLEEQPAVAAVNYPGLETHLHHDVAARQMRGYGGMLSFTLEGGFAAVKRVLPRLRLAHLAANLGAVETLAGVPATTSHVECTVEERAAMGIPEGLIRYSVGIEDAGDLMRDLEQAFAVA